LVFFVVWTPAPLFGAHRPLRTVQLMLVRRWLLLHWIGLSARSVFARSPSWLSEVRSRHDAHYQLLHPANKSPRRRSPPNFCVTDRSVQRECKDARYHDSRLSQVSAEDARWPGGSR